ncbi:helix-turn-helix domain-containing protein [Rhizobium sp. 1AS11]|uniref:helix-turn-helix transcriptional regulator n=1 Tax=Rhizobium acaciae TaxID=2989736 RepID=UPI002223578D|nr:helix-turn-helix domain-containing protein [Rhizobium acaciae]MCW1412161.1 helix-turn-helix domain-containing protein [Rhizobium acaciae]MCW1744176.1 helix-turn-helix domain-containing protein [Rhizobium acaciae]
MTEANTMNYTAPEVAGRLRVSEVTLARWRSTNKGPVYIKSGGRVLYRETDLKAYEAGNLMKGTRQPAKQ